MNTKPLYPLMGITDGQHRKAFSADLHRRALPVTKGTTRAMYWCMVLHADVDLHVDMTLEALTFLAGMTAKTATNSLRTLREVGLVAKCDGGGWELR